MKLSCLIVDDEQHGIDVVADYVNKIPYLNLIYSTTNSLEALDFIQKNKIDLVISDLHMPKLSGLALQAKIQNLCKVIFVTGYTERAIEAMKHNVIDILMKPLDYERFENATQKAFLLSPHQIDYLEREKKFEFYQKVKTLTSREKEILFLIGQKKTNQIIAQNLNISVETVETHRKKIRGKLELTGQSELGVFAEEINQYFK